MVKDYYYDDFPESSADDKPEMSQEELHFLKVLDSTEVLKEGRNKMALPLRDCEVTVPNNWVQAERQVLWLKRKLHDNKDLYTDYKVFMTEILEEGYARKVPAHTQGVNCVKWYIPHHGIYHPRKPGKTRVIFSRCRLFCEVSRKVTQLPLAQGSRFNEHIVRCIVVLWILKRRFYQVRVAEECYTNYQEDSSVPVRDQEHP